MPNMRMKSALAAGLLGLGVCGDGLAAERGGPLVVHEWGTFTNFAGSDGVQRKFATEIGLGANLPKFVMTYSGGGGSGEQQPVYFAKSELVCSQRMETPVIYIYPGCRGPVDIEARLLDGTMTEFYPPVNGVAGGKASAADHSVVRWEKVGYEADPAPESQPALPMDPDNKDSHYYRARATDACVLGVEAGGKTHHEKFLFYRGAANFESRVTVKALGGDKFEVNNTTGEKIAGAFIAEVREKKMRWARFEKVGEKALVALPELPKATPPGQDASGLQKSLEAELVKAGLFDREAKAMVSTWRDQWFEEEGTRVLYVMPGAEVNRVLPLKVNPTPDTLVRVFVGRSDVMTPENEAAIAKAVALDESKASEAARRAAWAAAPKLGRFQAAAVQRVQEQREAAGKLAGNGANK